MPTKLRFLSRLSFLVACLVAFACGPKREGSALHVTAYAPTGEVHDERATLRISFDAPVVADDEVGKPLEAAPVKISPALAVYAHFSDRQTLVLTPQRPLAPSTRYTVELTGALADRLEENFRYSFVHAPLAVESVQGLDERWTAPEPKFTVRFNQPLSAEQVSERCVIATKKGEVKVALRTPDPSVRAKDVALEAKAKLTLGGEYELRCKDLLVAGGNAPLAEPFVQPFRVVPPFALSSVKPTDGERVTPDELVLSLTFTAPVREADLEKYVELSPPHASFRRQWVRRDDTTYEIQVNLEAEAEYTLKVKAGLTDALEQKLGKAKTVRFTTTDASPSLSLDTGMYAVEAVSDGFPIWSRNVASFQVTCAHVPVSRIASVLSSDLPLYSWYGSSETIRWKTLGLKTKDVKLTPQSSKNKWTRTRFDFTSSCGTGQRGVYLAEVRSSAVEQVRKARGGGTYPYRVLANVTDLGLMLKVGPASGLVWVASLSTAAPVVNAQVTVYQPGGKKVWSGVTDAQGLAKLPGSDKLLPSTDDPYEAGEQWRDQRLIAVVEKDGDVAVVDGNWSDGIQAWNFGYNVDHSGGEVRVRGFIESDRGIYRPGETVHIKGLAREVPLQGEARVPRAQTVQARVEDTRGTTLLDKQLTLSEFGGFSFDLALDPEAPTGDYYVTAMVGTQTFRQTFSVEEIRPVSFEVLTHGVPEHMRLGQKAKVTLEARYLFGAPVADAPVTYQVQRRPRWVQFADYDSYIFEDWSESYDWDPWWEPDSYAEFVTEGDGRTDAQGKFAFEVFDTGKNVKGPQDYLVRATVRDATDQQVTKSVVIQGHPSDFYLGLRASAWVQRVNEPFTVDMVAVEPKGSLVGTKATLTLSRERWDCGPVQRPESYYTPCKRHLDVVWSRPVELTNTRALAEQVEAKEPGEHIIKLVAKDARGHTVSSAISLWVVGKGNTHWAGDTGTRMSLIASKTRYAPGETALLVPQADAAGALLLVTEERNGILSTRLERAEDGGHAISVALDERHAPNVYVSVAMIRPRRGPNDDERPELKLGVINLPVSFEQKRLKVEVLTEKSDFQPGDQVKGKVRVTRLDGTPVRAEVALSAADEGVLQLIGYKTPDPLATFYKSWGLGIDNAANWGRVARLQKGPAEADGEEGADSGGMSEDRVRSRFVASAYWAPALVTDANGEVPFSFSAPDNLTAFRLMAVAADAGTRFGSGEQRIRVRKDLLVAPIVPRFLQRDDDIELGAVVHNYTDAAGEVDVRLEVTGVTPAQQSVKLKVPAQGKAAARFPVKVGHLDEAKVKITAAMGNKRDVLEQTLPILLRSVTEYETVLEGRAEAARVPSLSWPHGLDLAQSAVEVLVDRVGLADLGPSLKYLVRYPYGCLEQTLSGLVPLLKVRDLATSLHLKELEGEKLDTFVRLGVAKVLRHQHEDGHFSLWPSGSTYPHLTVYALWGLNEARRAGVAVPKNELKRGLEAVRAWAHEGARTFKPGDETATIAMAAFVLADQGMPDTALNELLFDARKALPAYGKAFLLRAMLRAKASAQQTDTLSRELREAIIMEGDRARLADPALYDRYYFSSESRNMAMVISALLELKPTPSEVVPLVRALRALRRGGRWESTQENLYGLVALADYARAEAQGSAQVIVKVGERVLSEQTLTGGAILRARLPLLELEPGAALTISASEPVYYSAVMERVTPKPAASAVNRGIRVSREYLDYTTNQPILEAKVGQLVKVRVRVAANKNARYVAISDPLPSGFEPVLSRLATEQATRGDSYWDIWTHRDLRDERADWFVDDLSSGEHVLEYAIRATHAGRFVVPPVHAHEMYAPSFMGHGPSTIVSVTR